MSTKKATTTTQQVARCFECGKPITFTQNYATTQYHHYHVTCIRQAFKKPGKI
jgi:DNA-directed RNA polymerase subunit N (RpoN/RPB10)